MDQLKIIVFFMVLLVATMITGGAQIQADGKLLRGEKWQKFTAEIPQADFFVAPNGNDAWSGRLPESNASGTDGPFATLTRAQQAVRELKASVYQPKKPPIEKRWIGSPHELGEGKDILVLIRQGYYELTAPLEFTQDDGGERCETDLPSGAFEYHKLKDYYVTWAAFPGETPVISGGKRVTNWQPRGKKWVAKVDTAEITELVANGAIQTLARIPNTGYFSLEEIPATDTAFKFRKGDLKNWPGLENSRVIMLLRWHTGINSIVKIDEKQRLAFLKKPQKGIVVVPPRYYVENVAALLDAPGEWFFDAKTGELNIIPQQEIIDPNQANFVVPHIASLIQLKGSREKPVRNLRFYGLTFEATTAGSSALHFAYAHACEIVESRIRSVGGEGIRLEKGCYQTRILENDISWTKSSGIVVSGEAHPDNWTDIIRETIISRNSLAFCAGTSIGDHNTLFSTISHNEITRNFGRTAISVGGWRNLEEAITGGYRVEYNHLHHVQERADDSGAIVTSGMTYNSIVRGNLIHHVKAGYFNDNVAIWFDNMSSGWIAEDNIYYALEQGEMKLCAANLVDNLYRDNFLIETPDSEPEPILTGEPDFHATKLTIVNGNSGSGHGFQTGEYAIIHAELQNSGATGIKTVHLFVDGQVRDAKKVPAVRGNAAFSEFKLTFTQPGTHQIAVENSVSQTIEIHGQPLEVVYDDLQLSETIVPADQPVNASVSVKNITDRELTQTFELVLNVKTVQSQTVKLAPDKPQHVNFQIKPPAGTYHVKIGQTPEAMLTVYPHRMLDLSRSNLQTYISGTAHPCEFKIDAQKNQFQISASGTDLMHAEDSYGAIYLKKVVKRNFVATVKVKSFGEHTHEWFRAGIFARNDLAKSFDTEPGSLGSVFYFTTPGRTGIEWDEFGDGCMHKASSQNHPKTNTYPMWLKLVRHGNSFSGYISYDGVTWTNPRHTNPVPGIAETIDLGLAAGSCDQRVYTVEFEDFKIQVEDSPVQK